VPDGGRHGRARRRLRRLGEPFVVAPPAGVRVRTRLRLTEADAAVLRAVGEHLGVLAGRDLAWRCAQVRPDATGGGQGRAVRKQALTAACTSRWAGAITRTSEDAWRLAQRNLLAEQRSLRARVGRLRRRLAVPVGARQGRTRGYGTRGERWDKQRRLQVLQTRLRVVDARLAQGRISVCRGGRRLARARHNLQAAGLDERGWRRRWEAARWFLTADGEAGKQLGNETIRWDPDTNTLEVRLPEPLAQLANAEHGRYRIGHVRFPYRGDEVAAQTRAGAVRYDISYHPGTDRLGTDRWYLDASWTTAPSPPVELQQLRHQPVVAVDVNAGHFAAAVLDRSGNPVGTPRTVPLDLAGLPASVRDGRLRAATSELLRLARRHGGRAVVIEDLDFADARDQGRERTGRRPQRGRRGRAFRRQVAGIPTGRFRHRLVGMAANTGLAVVAVDPAYTSRWGAQHWLGALQQQVSAAATGHHAAAVIIGRRGLGQRARRRGGCDRTPPADGERRATNSAVRPIPAAAGLTGPRTRKPGNRKARGQPLQRQRTRPADRASPGDQATHDRSGPPTRQDSLLLSD
jgi:IS605 OrfB family transposase